ncbi:MAG TPA: septum formation initiator family protein [Sandaracinaceae bacterium LLY-WYZ-13_1]|nr:septum formation initiator family protein [Sandaracinaceae bacterium LLY-WYZ-13_1]
MSRFGRAVAWMLPFALLVLSIVSVPLSILDDEGLPRYRALKDELSEVERVNERLRRDVEQLDREVEGLRSDPEAIERIARDELGMIREDEILFQFPQ